jgi:SAM-dependent methyltransferase
MRMYIRHFLSLLGLNLADKDAFQEYALQKRIKGIGIPGTNRAIVRSSYKAEIDRLALALKASPTKADIPPTPALNWHPVSDAQNIKDSALLHRSYLSGAQYRDAYQSKYAASVTARNGRVFWRLETMRRLRFSRPDLFKGRVLEIGAGTSVVSAEISKFPEVQEVFALDYDHHTVDDLMPLVQWSMGSHSEKITRVVGSYNHLLSSDGFFDTIIAVGALHHSEDLSLTMRECFRALREGGSLIVVDYSLSSSLTQLEYAGLRGMPLIESEMEDAKAGRGVMTNKLNSEHGRPTHVYQAAAFNAGFSIETFLFDATTDTGGSFNRLLRYINTKQRIKNLFADKVAQRTIGYDPFGNVRTFSYKPLVYYPAYAKGAPSLSALALRGSRAGAPIYDNTLLICRKGHKFESQAIRYGSGNVYNMPISMLS